MLDPSQYDLGVAAEDFRQYCAGGYHPTRLHDRLKDGRYEIRNKLGFGSFSTVWLATDHSTKRDVSIKIVVASGLEKENHELEILQHLQTDRLHHHPGRRCVAQVFDSFFHEGPNGRHLCVVMELFGPSVSWVAERSKNYRLRASLALSVSDQVLEAVDYLHRCGVVHGDIHPGNILLRVPRLRAVDSPQIGKVSKKYGSPLEEGVPAYLVEPLEYDITGLDLYEGRIQLVDFGSAFFTTSPPKTIHTPLSLSPPELVFQRPLTQAVDIWNLGCTFYQLVVGRTLFEVGFDSRELIPQYQQILGSLPSEWTSQALVDGVLDQEPDAASTGDFLPLEEEVQRAYVDGYPSETLEFTRRDLEVFGRILRKVLIVDPEQRATIGELAHDALWASMDETYASPLYQGRSFV